MVLFEKLDFLELMCWLPISKCWHIIQMFLKHSVKWTHSICGRISMTGQERATSVVQRLLPSEYIFCWHVAQGSFRLQIPSIYTCVIININVTSEEFINLFCFYLSVISIMIELTGNQKLRINVQIIRHRCWINAVIYVQFQLSQFKSRCFQRRIE